MNPTGRHSPNRPIAARRRITISAACLLMASLSYAAPRDFDVGGGALRPALDAFIAQSGVQLIYKMEDVEDLSTRGVKGSIAPDAALARLLDGTRLRIRRGQDGAIVLVAPAANAASAPASAGKKP
ncbi:STN domain-containing protein [Xylophilus sp. ASV27]|uniref:STN domain-containing protein n=1 Tax=Xylophilus sp. ASV27 TaxID=2795129 RepID=UPI0018EDCC18|nr:STN domain-containing protein [Xylophilus sp. ASV27]